MSNFDNDNRSILLPPPKHGCFRCFDIVYDIVIIIFSLLDTATNILVFCFCVRQQTFQIILGYILLITFVSQYSLFLFHYGIRGDSRCAFFRMLLWIIGGIIICPFSIYLYYFANDNNACLTRFLQRIMFVGNVDSLFDGDPQSRISDSFYERYSNNNNNNNNHNCNSRINNPILEIKLLLNKHTGFSLQILFETLPNWFTHICFLVYIHSIDNNNMTSFELQLVYLSIIIGFLSMIIKLMISVVVMYWYVFYYYQK